MLRSKLIAKLKPYKEQTQISHALEILSQSNDEIVENEDIEDVWERVSKSIDCTFSDDEEHPIWALEEELASLYKR